MATRNFQKNKALYIIQYRRLLIKFEQFQNPPISSKGYNSSPYQHQEHLACQKGPTPVQRLECTVCEDRAQCYRQTHLHN